MSDCRSCQLKEEEIAILEAIIDDKKEIITLFKEYNKELKKYANLWHNSSQSYPSNHLKLVSSK